MTTSSEPSCDFAAFLTQELRNLETKLNFAYSCEVSRHCSKEDKKVKQPSLSSNGSSESQAQISSIPRVSTERVATFSVDSLLSDRLGPEPSSRRLTGKLPSHQADGDPMVTMGARDSTLSDPVHDLASMFGGSESLADAPDLQDSAADSLPSLVHEIFLRAHVDDSSRSRPVGGLNAADRDDFGDGVGSARCVRIGTAEKTPEDANRPRMQRRGSDTSLPSRGKGRRPSGWKGPGRRMSIMSSARSDEDDLARHSEPGLQASKSPRRNVQVGDMMLEDSFLQRLVGMPGSRYRIIWDVIGVLFVAYDGFMIPFMQAFHKSEIGTTLTMFMVVSTFFWTLDIPMSFLVGYHVEGLIEMRMSRISRRYLKTWLIPDIGIVMLDWVFIVIGLVGEPSANDNSAGLARVARTVRVFRMFRIVRLLRLPKLFRKLRELHARIRSELLRVCFQMWGLMGIMMILTHFVACAWYAVGICMWGDITFCDEPLVDSWTFASFTELAEDSIMYRYFTSLQWAAAQFTLGNSGIDATCLRERCFAVLVLWFGLVVFSVFVSSITTNMTQLRQINSEQFHDEEALKVYLVEHKVSVELGRCIMEFFNVYRSEQKLQDRQLDIRSLQAMPDGLKRQLAIEVFMPPFAFHPFFRFLREVDRTRLAGLCNKAMSEIRLKGSEELFNIGVVSKGLYFLNKGSASYTIDPEVISLESGQWFAEATLWMSKWIHCGRLAATDGKGGADLFLLDADEFRTLIRGSEQLQDVKALRYGAAYAVSFVTHQCAGTGLLFRRTDIWGTVAELSEIASRAAEGTRYEWRSTPT